MRLEFKSFLILILTLFISNMIAQDISESTNVPHVLIYFVLTVLLSAVLIMWFTKYLSGKLRRLNNAPSTLMYSLDEAWKLVENIDTHLSSNEKLISEVKELVSDNIIVLDTQLKVTDANAVAFSNFGKNIVGLDVEDIINDSGFLGALKLAELNASELRTNFVLPSNNKTYKAIIKPHLWHGELNRFIIAMHDVSKDLELEDRIQEFNINLSHEIRTPITAILTASETIIQDDFAKEVSEEFVPIIHKQSQKLVRLTKEMNKLWVSNISKSKPVKDEVDVGSITRELALELSEKLRKNSIELALNLPKKKAPRIAGKADQIKELLLQIVGNAITHGGANKRIDVNISFVRLKSKLPAFRLNNGKALKVSIVDQGPGIDNNHIGKLTSTFYKADQSRASNKSNFGLGLAIVQKILDRHKGTLKITSKKGKGSEFSVYFPLSRKSK